MKLIQYDGHRRIQLPYLGSVRMTRSLPKGIHYEVSISRRNGRWYATLHTGNRLYPRHREKPNQ